MKKTPNRDAIWITQHEPMRSEKLAGLKVSNEELLVGDFTAEEKANLLGAKASKKAAPVAEPE
jgi:hypothetical protein